MFTIEKHFPLDRHNTFGFPAIATCYGEASDDAELLDLLAHADATGLEPFVLGGGSNVVLTGDVSRFVLRLTANSVSLASDIAGGATLVTADAGLGWHDLVERTLDLGLAGLENLSLIPGTVGAAPVQNIGAYGVELDQRLVSLRAWHRPSGRWRQLRTDECGFGYRDSRFKRERGDWIITSATFDLGPHRRPSCHYGALAEELARRGIEKPSSRDISDAVIAIRREKLPDPSEIGNAGSFFHNPVVTATEADALSERFPDMIRYPQPDGRVKLAAGWLIDQLGFRGFREHGVGVHDRQALVLVNTGTGNGRALIALAERIMNAVEARYGVTLSIEPLVL